MNQPLRVLYAEDDVADADLTKTHFTLHAPDIELEIVETGEQCLAQLGERTYDVLLLDNRLPDMEGIDVLREVARREVQLPVVMVTGVGDEALVLQVLRLGALDYVPKDREYLTRLPAVLKQVATAYRLRARMPAEGRRLRRILYVERHSADVDLTRSHFAKVASHFVVDVAHTSVEALAALDQNNVDLVLADLRLPDLNALDLLREMRRRGMRVPLIVITGKGDEHAALTALKLGASDYMIKRDNYLTQLPYAIENAIARAQLADANERLQLELREKEQAEKHVRELNRELHERVLHRTRQLEDAQQELEETRVLELIAENAPLTEICGRLASLLARRTQTIVSVTTLPPTERFKTELKTFMPTAVELSSRHDVRAHASLSIATPDGTADSAVSLDLAGSLTLALLERAERMSSRAEFPITSRLTDRDLGYVTIYQDVSQPLGSDIRRVLDRCTKLAAIAIHRAVSEDRIRRQALEDPLTGLPNRALWSDRLEQALAASRRQDTVVAVLLYDLDRFKDINDTFGHDTGDRVLRHVAAQLAGSMRPSDTVGRLGGDEFAVVLPDLPNIEEAERIAERGLVALDEPLQIDGALLTLKASVGVALHPTHAEDPVHLLRRADAAMYRAKRLGGVATFEAQKDHEQLDSLVFVAQLQHAIEGDQLTLCYQPKINLRTGRATGVECLLRWDHPTRGTIRPVQLIPLAESTGLIKPLSVWVIRRGLEDCRSWYASGIEVPVAVNLSAPLLYDRELPDIIQRQMEAHDISRGHLEVEITESTLMLDPEMAMKTIGRLRESGVGFALDDFGTGYSSLAHLKNLQVQSIKIDQSFVRDMVTDARDASIVKAAIELGHSFGLDIVAEGVESVAVRHLLETLGCDYAQGFHFAKPMTSADFLTWYQEH